MTAIDNVLKAVIERFAEYPNIERAVLFGSRARGDNGERSDYDIAVYGSLERKDKTALRYFCDEELPTLHKIDLIFMEEQTASEFTRSIEREGVEIYGKA